jgi:hypothetical protein
LPPGKGRFERAELQLGLGDLPWRGNGYRDSIDNDSKFAVAQPTDAVADRQVLGKAARSRVKSINYRTVQC